MYFVQFWERFWFKYWVQFGKISYAAAAPPPPPSLLDTEHLLHYKLEADWRTCQHVTIFSPHHQLDFAVLILPLQDRNNELNLCCFALVMSDLDKLKFCNLSSGAGD